MRPRKRLRTSAYVRVSSASDDQLNSFAAQSRYYTALISGKETWTMVDIYADEGITGTSMEKRKDFQRLLADCRRGLIDRVLVKSISRFARNTKECLEVLRELKLLGTSVYFEKENINTATMSGEMMTTLFASFAQSESESISSNMRWGIQARMQNGTFVPSNQPFGYKLIDKQIVIDIPQARFVCEMFSAYLSGWNTQEIADYLNNQQQNHPELCGRVWSCKAVSRILRNEKYVGDSLWQKTYRTDTLPTRELTNRGEREQYYASNTHPAIIDQNTYKRVQDLLAKRNSVKSQSIAVQQSPFQRMVVCSHCGGYLRQKQTNGQVYRSCRKHDAELTVCPLTPVPEREIEKAFLRLYYKLKHHSEPVLAQMLTGLQTIRSRRMLWSLDIIELNKQISDLTSQNQMLTKLKQQGFIDPDIFIAQSNDLTEQLRTAKQKKERLLINDGDTIIGQTQELLDILDTGPDLLDTFDVELFGDLIEKVFIDSNTQLRFRLKNGLELTEAIERTVH